MAIERWVDKDHKTKVETHRAAVSPEKFDFACRLFQVPADQQMEAFRWCSVVAEAAREAPRAAPSQTKALLRDPLVRQLLGIDDKPKPADGSTGT